MSCPCAWVEQGEASLYNFQVSTAPLHSSGCTLASSCRALQQGRCHLCGDVEPHCKAVAVFHKNHTFCLYPIFVSICEPFTTPAAPKTVTRALGKSSDGYTRRFGIREHLAAMATKTSTHRLRKELRNISREPPPHITARPLPSNILKWYFVLEGPTGTPYEGGLYLGRLQFPEQYPFKPPAVYMCTPQGRFKCNQKLCLSMSDFHPETWNPLWSVSAVLTGLLSFMLGSEDTVGSVATSSAEKRALARSSHTHNRGDKVFRELFPEFLRDSYADAAVPARQVARSHVPGSSARRARRNDDEGESLVSLLAWLVVFVAVIFAIFRLIAGPAS